MRHISRALKFVMNKCRVMSSSGSRRRVPARISALALVSAFAAGAVAWSADEAAGHAMPSASSMPAATRQKSAGAAADLLPAPKSIRQSAIIGGKKVDYVLTVGAIPLRDGKGTVTGEIVYTSYVVSQKEGPGRPVTFSLNGGPGAASAYLNLGAIGPKHIHFGRNGVYASQSGALNDNPNSWLDFTDLVFIDPIGTGYSRSHLGVEATRKTFLTSETDVHYLAEAIDLWLSESGRMLSPKYLIGESYGGYRVPRLAAYMQSDMGIGVSGITMVSPFIDPAALTSVDELSPLALMVALPSMAAAVKEAHGQPVTAQTMAPIETYARTEFVEDVFAGQRDKAATDRLVSRLSEYLDLDPKFIRRLKGHITSREFKDEAYRDQDKVASYYDLDQLSYDPFPELEGSVYFDPSLGATAPFAEAMTYIINSEVGWKVDARYYLNNFDVARTFDHTDFSEDLPVRDLRKALSNDPHMSVLIANGYFDAVCPYFLSKLILRQMPDFGDADRIKAAVYPGGHMFYAHAQSALAFKRDAMHAYGMRAQSARAVGDGAWHPATGSAALPDYLAGAGR